MPRRASCIAISGTRAFARSRAPATRWSKRRRGSTINIASNFLRSSASGRDPCQAEARNGVAMKPEEHELLSRTSAGTPMGDLLRRYWLPALLSRELEAEGAPVRVRLLGEDLIAFRDSKGRVGLLHEHCSHRGASLYFAKNADCGLRCWYHGWKYDIDGTCIDMPNEPPQSRFAERIKHPSYPCIERNGVVMT